MNVLSLFDGMSGGQIALNRVGIKYDNYFASEIDSYAIKVTMANYPHTIQIGSITDVKAENLPKIDLLIGGSPCQGFSFAGKRLNFDDPRSKLFFEYVRLLKECKPKYFLLENVRMKKEYQAIISEHLGVDPIEINSSLVSAQNRRRLYWTNIPDVKQPADKGILLKDIIENAETEKEKSYCIDASYYKGASYKQYKEKSRRQLVKCGAIRGRNEENPKSREVGLPTKQMLEIRADYKTNCLTTVQKDNVIVSRCIQVGEADIKGNDSIKRVYSTDGKSSCLTTCGGGHREPKISEDNITWRKLTPLECERLQTVPEQYTEHVSNSQRYKMLGNGWTVDVIAHIFKGLKNEVDKNRK